MSIGAQCERCLAVAACELRAGHSDRWVPFCRECADAEHETCAEVYAHEMDHFGGAYGLPVIHERPLGDAEAIKRGRRVLAAMNSAGLDRTVSQTEAFAWLSAQDRADFVAYAKSRPSTWAVWKDVVE